MKTTGLNIIEAVELVEKHGGKIKYLSQEYVFNHNDILVFAYDTTTAAQKRGILY